ncbi:WecD Histone acetyltransferase HPA2 and related acetyltransferases [Flavobacteriaceae bacterium]
MISFLRTHSENPDFKKLVVELDAILKILDGEDHVFYADLNQNAVLNEVLIAFENNAPVGCGAFRTYSENIVEIKRMYVPELYRNKGIASKILAELEAWAKELGNTKCILETGIMQVEAIGLYPKNGYEKIENYGNYKGVANSICFGKTIG